MPKYGDIIKQAKTSKPENQTARKPDNQMDLHDARSPQTPSDGQQATRKPDSQATRKPDSQIASQPDEPLKNLCVKVPESWRRHWSAQAKLTGRTMTDVMVEALTTEFGLPDNQITR